MRPGVSQLSDRITCFSARYARCNLWINTRYRSCHWPRAVVGGTRHTITAVCRAGYNQLCQLRPLVCSLSVYVTKTFVQASLFCRLDYCNSLLYDINDGLLCSPESAHIAARLVTGAGRCDHISPLLRQLHWLPDCQRVTFEVPQLVYQSLAGFVTRCYVIDTGLLLWQRWLSNSRDIRCEKVPLLKST